MLLAVLMTNTDESDFAQRHPKDGKKFSSLIHGVKPDWVLTTFSVKDGEFPADVGAFDGVIITGSPASVRDKAPWVKRLLELIKITYSRGIPIFGACFGHQAIALALGGEIGANPAGWVFGLTETTIAARAEWMGNLPQTFCEFAAHNEAVTNLPEGAEVVTHSQLCKVAGFRIGRQIFTTQNHPEMTAPFMAALIAEYQRKLPTQVAKAAQESMTKVVDTLAYAQTIAQFFENPSAD